MADTNRETPYFIVGTDGEAASVHDAGFDAWNVGSMDARGMEDVARRIVGEGRQAVVILSSGPNGKRDPFMRACDLVGLAAHAVTQGRINAYIIDGENDYASLCRIEAEDAAIEHDERRAIARERQLHALHVYDTTDIAMDLYNMDVTLERIPTGLANLDEATGGGLPGWGLTVLGAGSSNGKTTLAIQWADHIAASGRDVLFVTLEQSRHEMVSKSLSRMMRQTHNHVGGYYAVAADEIMVRERRDRWTPDQNAALLTCCARYTQEVAPHLHYLETSKQPSFKQIKRAFEALCAEGKKSPVLFVDYLQIIKAMDDRASERKAIDDNVSELRKLARDYDTAVVVISSINRQSYAEGAGLSGFKESGMVEYSCDLALMLQPRGFSDAVGKERTDKGAREKARTEMAAHKGRANRQSEIVVLKNRSGMMPKDPVPLLYDAKCNLFTADTETEKPKRNIR